MRPSVPGRVDNPPKVTAITDPDPAAAASAVARADAVARTREVACAGAGAVTVAVVHDITAEVQEGFRSILSDLFELKIACRKICTFFVIPHWECPQLHNMFKTASTVIRSNIGLLLTGLLYQNINIDVPLHSNAMISGVFGTPITILTTYRMRCKEFMRNCYDVLLKITKNNMVQYVFLTQALNSVILHTEAMIMAIDQQLVLVVGHEWDNWANWEIY